MKRMSPEMDQLIWLVAESGDPAAVEQFVQRYPEARRELFRRMDMVKSLRGAKPAHIPVDRIPAFRPTIVSTPRPIPRLAFAGGLLCAAALAVGSFTYFRSMRETKVIEPTPGASKVATTPVNGPNCNSLRPPDELHTLVKYKDRLEQPGGDGRVRPKDRFDDRVSVPPPGPMDPMDKPITLDLRGASLFSVLRSVGTSVGRPITFLPGDLEDVKIDAQYASRPAKEVLQDLGRTYGFTASDQGPDGIFIVPAVDEKTQADGPELPDRKR